MATTNHLPPAIEECVELLARMPGVIAVVLGGSRATGTERPDSDWDLGVYYRGALDTSRLAARTTVYPPGAWGRLMNGGAWLTCDGAKVDVLLRDLDVVEEWSRRADEGVYEVDNVLGYLAGLPTYSLVAERSVARLLRGDLPGAPGRFSERLATSASERWRFHARFSLDYAAMHARQGDVLATLGQVSKGVIELAHARLCEQRIWAVNEKRIVSRAGLSELGERYDLVPREPARLEGWVDEVRRACGIEPLLQALRA
jgi:predicted nucleotidyltransferase